MEILENQFSKNQMQLYFNQVKGKIIEINFDELYSNVTISVGHNNSRQVNFVAKTPLFKKLMEGFNVGDKVTAKFYLSSNKKNDRYYTTATILDIKKEPTIYR
jgi:hypothetical protein